MNKTKANHATDPNAQTAKAEEGSQAAQQAHTRAVAAATGTGSAVATAQTTTTPDENHGRGGRYIRQKDGTRVLEDRTLSEAEHAKAEAEKAKAD